MVSKFILASGRELTIFTAGDFRNKKVYYKLAAIPCTLSLSDSP